jgi:hypothetical protein
MNLLVPNLGSTSLKYQILEMPSEKVLGRGRFERVRDYGEAIAQIGAGGVPVDAVVFKAVHAGPRYCGTFASTMPCCSPWKSSCPPRRRITPSIWRPFAPSAKACRAYRWWPPLRRSSTPPCPPCARLWRARRVARGGRTKVWIPRRLAPIRGRTLRRAAGPPDAPGKLPLGRQLVDVRHRPRPVHRHYHGLLAAIRPGERHAAWRSGRLRRALHDGASRLDLRAGARATRHRRRAGRPFRDRRRRCARSGTGRRRGHAGAARRSRSSSTR